jgi:hypothetical protein
VPWYLFKSQRRSSAAPCLILPNSLIQLGRRQKAHHPIQPQAALDERGASPDPALGATPLLRILILLFFRWAAHTCRYYSPTYLSYVRRPTSYVLRVLITAVIPIPTTIPRPFTSTHSLVGGLRRHLRRLHLARHCMLQNPLPKLPSMLSDERS